MTDFRIKMICDKCYNKWIYTVLLFVSLLDCSSGLQGTAINVTCPAGWQKLDLDCFKLVQNKSTWDDAFTNCQSVGATLVTLKDIYDINTIANVVKTQSSGSIKSYWIGLSRHGVPPTDPTQVKWNNVTVTTTRKGYWNIYQPNMTLGRDCVKADEGTFLPQWSFYKPQTHLWSFTKCSDKLPSVCRLNVCPAGWSRCKDGKCIQDSWKCDGHKDCSDGSDEEPSTCPSKCDYSLSGANGTFSSKSFKSPYVNFMSCVWTITTTTGSRAFLKITSIDTETSHDVITVYTGNVLLPQSTVLARVSGTGGARTLLQQFTSQNNVIMVRFYADNTVAKSGFDATWGEGYECKTLSLSNTAQSGTPYQEVAATSVTTCAAECDKNASCATAVFASSKCKLYTDKGMPTSSSGATLIGNACPGAISNKVLPSPPAFGGSLTATNTWQSVSSPIYPFYTPGYQKITWTIDTQAARGYISIQVEDLDLQDPDNVEVKDGKGGTVTPIVKYPGSGGATLFYSTTRSVTITFLSQRQSSRRGFLFSYKQTEFGCPAAGKTLQWYTQTNLTINTHLKKKNVTAANLTDCQSKCVSETTFVCKSIEFLSQGSPNCILSPVNRRCTTTIPGTTPSPTPPNTYSEWVCTEKCPTFPADSNAVLNPSPPPDTFQSQVTKSCKTGYYFGVKNYTSKTEIVVTCYFGGMWSLSNIPQCSRVYCGPPPRVQNGYTRASSGVLYQDSANYSCYEGYTLQGTPMVTCGSNGSWSTPAPTCKVVLCSESPNVTLATKTVQNGTGTSVGSTVTYSCSAGYQIVGSPRTVCKSNGSWTDTPPTCTKLQCLVPSITNGALTNTTGPFYLGDTVNVTCNNGFKLNGTGHQITCLNDQTFGTLPKCQNVNECTQSQPPCNQTCTDTEGSYVCSCKPGYTLDTNGKDCKDVNECNTTNGGCSQKCSDVPGSYVCSCNEGYTLFTSNGTNGFNIRNGETGLRAGDVYRLNHTCVRNKCPSPSGLNITNGVATMDLNSLYYNGTITFDCNIGYILNGQKTIRCLANNTWDALAPTCQNVQCDPANLTGLTYAPTPSTAGKVNYMAQVTYNCTKFLPKPIIKKRTCRFDASRKYLLIGDNLECPVVDCGAPANITGAKIPSLSNTLYGSSYTFQCDSLMTLLGNSSLGNATITCTAGGYWDYEDVRCVGETCTDPGRAPDAVQYATSYAIGKNVSYTCKRSGYALTSSDSLVCVQQGTNLTWNGTRPNCTDVEKPNITCPNTTITVKKLDRVNVTEPTTSDNTGVKVVETAPANFNLEQRVNKNMSVIFTARDYVGLSATCSVNIVLQDNLDLVPPTITCPASYTQDVTSTTTEYVKYRSGATGSHVGGDAVTITYQPANGTLPVNSTLAYTAYTITAEAKSKAGLTATCKFQVALTPAACTDWSLADAANATRVCNGSFSTGYSCTYTCTSGYYFHDGTTTKTFTCTAGNSWSPNSYIPDCTVPVLSQHLVRFPLIYSYPGAMDTSCETKIKQEIVSKASALGSGLTSVCDTLYSLEPNFEVKVHGDLIATSYNNTKNEFYVKLFISANPANSSYDVKCIDSLSIHLNSTDKEKLTDYKPFRTTLLSITVPGCPKVGGSKKVVGTGTAAEDVYPCPDQRTRISIPGGENDLCLYCSSGYFFNNATKSCQICETGYYQDNIGSTSCTECPNGTSTNNKQSKSASACKPTCSGFLMISTSGMPPCKQCPVDQTPTNATSCTNCPSGQKTLNTGNCTDKCPKGEYSPTGYPPCVKCPANFYQDLTGETNCKECADGTITNSTGATAPSSCINGTDSLCKPTNPCPYNASCSVAKHTVKCNCPKGFSGDLCQTNIDECASEPCYNDGACKPGNGTYNCSCPTGFSGTNCEVDANDCGSNTCKNGGMCKDGTNNVTCMCLPESGFTGKFCDVIKNVCAPNPCNNSAVCESFGNVRYRCNCKPGYTGSNCETDINECSPNPCLNGGNCTKSIGNYSCSCPTGFSGNLCEVRKDPCVNQTCSGNGKCIDDFMSGTTSCSCKLGYHQSSTTTCSPMNFCGTNPCQNSATCQNATMDYTCANCNANYEGYNCQHNKNDCASSPCKNGDCTDLLGSYNCTCKTGWTGKNCDSQVNYCTLYSPCNNAGSTGCNQLVADYSCNCSAGYTGKNCSENINDCASFPCRHGASCKDLVNDYNCTCQPGWEGKQCDNITDSCKAASNPNTTCYAGFIKPYSVCRSGYFGSSCSQAFDACSTLQPCVGGGSTCSAASGNVSCSCSQNYTNSGCEIRKDNTVTHVENVTYTNGSHTCLKGFSGSDCKTPDNQCSATPCPSGATCRNAVMTHQCVCPNGKAGPSCKAITQNYDICFNSTDAYAIQSKPFLLNTSTLTVSFWLRYYKKASTGGLFSLYAKSVWQETADVKEIIFADNTGVKVALNGTSQNILYPQNSKVNDGTWMRITIKFNSGKVSVMYKLMSDANSDKTFSFTGNLPRYGVIVLGSRYDWQRKQPVSAKGFMGCISKTEVWNRVLTRNEIDDLINDKPVTSGQVSGWSGFELYGAAAYAEEPSQRSTVCPVGFGGTNCRNEVPDKTAPVVNCPSDVFATLGMNYTGDSTTVSWSHATSAATPVNTTCNLTPVGRQDGIPPRYGDMVVKDMNAGCDPANMAKSRCNGSTFKWGRHTVIYQMKDTSNNVGFCHFHVYVRADSCTKPKTPKGGGKQACEVNAPYTTCSISCTANTTKAICVPAPQFYTCGPSGQWNYQNRFLNMRYPTCGDLKTNIKRRLRFVLYYPQLDSSSIAPTSLENEIKEIFSTTIKTAWAPEVCPAATCNVTATCSNECHVTVVSLINSPFLTSNPPANPPGTVKRIDDALRDYASASTFENKLRVGGKDVLDKTRTVIRLEPVCPTLFQAVGENCVQCGPGYFYQNSTLTCERCRVGSYQPQAGQYQCIPCAGSGQSTKLPGACSILDCKVNCNAGTYLALNNTKCLPCPLNQYQPYEDRDYCLNCSIGFITRQNGSVNSSQCIKDCPSGQGLTANNTCVVCQQGWYRTQGDTLDCQKCPGNFTTLKNESIAKANCSVADCSPGTYRNTSASPEVCIPCPKGSYQPNGLATSCISCTGLNTTQGPGAKAASECKVDCPAGEQYIAADSKCEPCPVGYYRTGGYNTSLDCSLCPNGNLTPNNGSTTQSNCTVANCSAGTYRDPSTETCIPCGNGAYQPQKWKLSCLNCSFGNDTGGKTGSTSPSDCITLNKCKTNSINCSVNAECKYNLTTTVTYCVCKDPYTGNGSKCQHPCETNSPCQNGATCKPDGDKMTCICTEGLSGEFCQIRQRPQETDKMALIFGIIGTLTFIILVLLGAVWICWCLRKNAEKKPPSLDENDGAYVNPIFDSQRSVVAQPFVGGTLRSFYAPSYTPFNDDTSVSMIGGPAPSVAGSVAVFSPSGRVSTRGQPDGGQYLPQPKSPKASFFDDDGSDHFNEAAFQ